MPTPDAAQLRLLYELTGSVLEASSIDEVHGAALDALGNALGPCRSAVLTYGDSDRMRFRAWRGLSDRYRAAVDGHSPWQRDTTDASPIAITDVLLDPAMVPFLPAFEAEGIRGIAFVPLFGDKRLLGKFMIYFDSPRELRRSEIAVASTIANHVAMALVRFDALAELRHALEMHEIFNGVLAHDLRTPLHAVASAAELLDRTTLAPEQRTLVKHVARAAERMSSLVTHLLDLTNLRRGQELALHPVRTALSEIAREPIEDLALAHPGRHVELAVQGDTSGEWDPERVAQLFANLVGNAVIHGTPGTVPSVSIDGRAPSEIAIEICNERRPASRPAEGGSGLGLGLYISRAIVDAHGGRMRFDASDKTVRVHVVLPRTVSVLHPPPG